MMKTKILSLSVILALAMFSCQDADQKMNTNPEEDLVLKSAEIAVVDMMTESVVEEANYEGDLFAESEHLLRQLAHIKGSRNLINGKKGMRYIEGHCPDVSIDTAETGYPIIITLDYGDSTELKNGRVISGTVIVELSAEKGTDGATRTISYVDCVIDSVSITGSSTEQFNGDNVTTRQTTVTSDIQFTMADGTVVERLGNHVKKWLEGLDTPLNHTDDMIEITGTLEATWSTGEIWSRDIIEPLIRLGDCRYHVQGIVQYSQNGEIISSLNYGQGECDNLAELSSDGETIEIELQGRKPKAKYNEQNRYSNGQKKGN